MQGKPGQPWLSNPNSPKSGAHSLSDADYIGRLESRLATYEAALREIAALEGLLTQSMTHEAINIACKALEGK